MKGNFRKLSLAERRARLNLPEAQEEDLLADRLIEACVGTYPVPLGIATGFLIDGVEVDIPLATEEASVVAAATHAARLVKAGGGFETWADAPILGAQVFLLGTEKGGAILAAESAIKKRIDEEIIPSIAKRGGGYRGVEVEQLAHALCVTLYVDVRDAMGANVVNTVVEKLKGMFCDLTGGEVLMAIVSNSAKKRRAGATFKIPARHFRKEGFSGEEICRRIVLATEVANGCPDRAVTHNKGIMNGISALALATGNDTRAIEAGAHFFAGEKTLTYYEIEKECLVGKIELPLALGTVGGAISSWPASMRSLQILGNPDARTLSRYAAAVGLAQNLAALFALVTEGIQAGHMRLHNRRKSL